MISNVLYIIEKEIKHTEEFAPLSKDVETVTKDKYPSPGTNRTANSSLDKTAEANKSKTDASSFFGKLFFSFIALYRGWRHYKEYRVALAGLALAFLYFTVLGFDNITIGKIDMCYVKNSRILKGAMLFNATFSNMSVISWRSVLLVGETVRGENHQPVASR